MNRIENKAFEYAKEIVVAGVQSQPVAPCKENGEAVADYFEEIYKRLLTIEQNSTGE